MTSVGTEFAQVARRVGYFLCVGDVSGYTVTEGADYNSWSAVVIAGNSFAQNDVLEDMGEVAKYQGSILRKVRKVTQNPAGGALSPVWIVVPGGEYPIAGFAGTPTASPTFTGLTPARVARLG